MVSTAARFASGKGGHGLSNRYIEVNQAVCIGSANCVAVAKGAFRLNEDGVAEAADPDAVSIETLLEAEEQCPVAAILVDSDEIDE